ncbi:gamma-glutamyl-gamma-aminobutyrate hydrolase family protein [Fictibacillus terranigra]|uniref:Gamma-glutamyl-gamma-aminobutyrate hydrolase family protein n=1 Tax=Fictibacillus terranigra TaxID=3058424 RepID=A0ABT8E5I7_9BACL|nr:gamma-glutamyl-gamma-aminobutyrate hydrolase family protein [Fictibacillus sp. CENA-BCM004]MDN4073177.1 gamma-glutamyl-gamma-aminobutyrate hydrolase family protein [Fictibacillus sp. CENA-BCM004]
MNKAFPIIVIPVSSADHNGTHSSILHQKYSEAIIQAGGLPVLLPSVDKTLTEQMIKQCDGIVLPGGDDVDPFYYQQHPKPELGTVNRMQDAFEIHAVRFAEQNKKPLLGICRGMNILNVAFGGTLIQHIPAEAQQAIKHKQQAPRNVPTHEVVIKSNSLLYELTGTTTVQVNSFHHQSINSAAPPLLPCAFAPDGIVEAIEGRNRDHFILGVQWHPEELTASPEMLNLFQAFINAAKSGFQ